MEILIKMFPLLSVNFKGSDFGSPLLQDHRRQIEIMVSYKIQSYNDFYQSSLKYKKDYFYYYYENGETF